MKYQTSIRPALTLSEKIQIILGSCSMKNKDKIDAILVLVESEVREKDICLNWPKIRQQLTSEILNLFSKIEENQTVINRGYIYRRISLAWQNCRERGWSIPRNFRENGCDYLENLLKKQEVMYELKPKKEEKKKEKKKKRNTGWHSRTWDRYNKFYFGVTAKAKKQPAREKQGRLPIN